MNGSQMQVERQESTDLNSTFVQWSYGPDGKVFKVFAKGRQWIRVVDPAGIAGGALWLEFDPLNPLRDDIVLSEELNDWLEMIWEYRANFKTLKRFPRVSEWLSVPRFDPRNVAATNWLIENLLVEGSIQLIFGPPGSYKTTVCYYLAKIVSSGKTIDGTKVPKRRVIIFDFENPASVIAARCRELSLGLPDNENLINLGPFLRGCLGSGRRAPRKTRQGLRQ